MTRLTTHSTGAGCVWAEVETRQNSRYFEGVLHELIHASGSFRNYDDRVLAEAVKNLGLAKNDAKLPDRNDVIKNSQFWDYALTRACVPGASRDTEWQRRLADLLRR
jgi:hypothetical protein